MSRFELSCSSFHHAAPSFPSGGLRSNASQCAKYLLIGLIALAIVEPAFSQIPGSAASAPPVGGSGQAVKALLTQSRVVTAPDGSEKLEDASKVRPGDVIEYKVTYTNTGGSAVKGLVAALPIPDGLEYQARSAKPAGDAFKAAAEDGHFAAEPLMQVVDGKQKPVPYSSYRNLQWALGQLPPQGSVSVAARAQVQSVIPVLPVLQASPVATKSPAPK